MYTWAIPENFINGRMENGKTEIFHFRKFWKKMEKNYMGKIKSEYRKVSTGSRKIEDTPGNFLVKS